MGPPDLADPHTAWTVEHGDSPLVATAIHAGHALRPEVEAGLALPESARLREEDPLTDLFASVAPTVVRVQRSRFEVDLNRPRDASVYRTPDDAWGLEVWEQAPSDELVARSLAIYDSFYGSMRELIGGLVARWGRVVVYDLHSYNHRRDGADAAPDDPNENPELNLGTGTMDRARWGDVVEAFVESASASGLDVRENVKFQGGNFAEWLHGTFPTTVCVLSLEMKKTFMDEWASEADVLAIERVRAALRETVAPVLAALEAGP